MLLLDEPTNHLEIEAREALEDALIGFAGTIIMDFARPLLCRASQHPPDQSDVAPLKEAYFSTVSFGTHFPSICR